MAESHAQESALDVLTRKLGYSITERWRENKGICFADRRHREGQCGNRRKLPAGGESSLMGFLDALSVLDPRLEPEACAEKLEMLVDAAVCHWHKFIVKTVARKWREQQLQVLSGSLSSLVPTQVSSGTPTIPTNDLSTVAPLLDIEHTSTPTNEASVEPQVSISEHPPTLANGTSVASLASTSEQSPVEPSSPALEPSPTPTTDLSVEPISQPSSRYNLRSTTTATTTTTTTTTSTLPTFIPYTPIHSVLTKLSKPLTPLEHWPGHIYIYTTPSLPSHLKIGFTTQSNPNTRLDQWRSQCRRQITPIYLSSSPIPNVRRVEQLIHAELADLRWKEVGCRGCGKTHGEWFRADRERVMGVVKKWEEWVSGEERWVEGHDGVWRLKKDEEEVVESPGRREESARTNDDGDVLSRIEMLVAEMGARFERRIVELVDEVEMLRERLEGGSAGRSGRRVSVDRPGHTAGRAAVSVSA